MHAPEHQVAAVQAQNRPGTAGLGRFLAGIGLFHQTCLHQGTDMSGDARLGVPEGVADEGTGGFRKGADLVQHPGHGQPGQGEVEGVASVLRGKRGGRP
ncbi:hypothetical protein COCCU_00040 [Corynebacterium occultum]|uniref:Uncharacterized protein n=1 Tax=Corynebacterium occultum TaxID=2675219 RepID=A0A6B8VSE1_9CORY|nr:hypothetical protein COCCU_00040 [Corynebacterium occultum]